MVICIFNINIHEQITAVLIQFHWLPVEKVDFLQQLFKLPLLPVLNVDMFRFSVILVINKETKQCT